MEKEPSSAHPLRWPYLLTGLIAMLFAGVLYAWSILKAPLADSFGWTPSDLGLNFTLTMCFFCVGGVVSGVLTKKVSPKLSLVVGAVLACAGFVITSRLSADGLPLLYLAYGGMSGLGIGIAYNAIIVTVNAWFPDRKGMCTGVLMLGYGLSTLVLGSLAGRLITTEGVGWRVTYVAVGASIGVVLLLAALILKFPPAGTAFPAPRPKMVRAGAGDDFAHRDYTTAEMVRRFTFWRFFLCTITTSAVGNTVISIARDLTMSAGAAAATATMLVGVLSVCNGLGRIFCGMMFDLIGRRRTMLFFGAVTISAAAVTLMAVLAGSLPLMIAGICLVGVSYGSSPTTNAAFTAEFYGARYYAMNFGVSNTMLIPASFMATLAGSLVTATGSFVLPCVILLGSSIVSMLLCLTIRRP